MKSNLKILVIASGCALAASLIIGCQGNQPGKPVSPASLGIGGPVLPGGKGVNTKIDNNKPRTVPTGGV